MRTKLFLVCISIFFNIFFSSLKAQTLMTNAEIYNYNIGDIFEIKMGGVLG